MIEEISPLNVKSVGVNDETFDTLRPLNKVDDPIIQGSYQQQ